MPRITPSLWFDTESKEAAAGTTCQDRPYVAGRSRTSLAYRRRADTKASVQGTSSNSGHVR
jgi:hypothetical protein